MVGRGSALLALTMGLGKTVTSIAAIEDLADNGALTTGLIIVPNSLKYQWQREILRFTGQRALVIDGPKAKREKLYSYAFRHRYVVTNYDSVVNDWNVVRDLPLDYIVCDEATAIKDPRPGLKKIKFRQACADPHRSHRAADREQTRGAVQHHGVRRPRGARSVPEVRPHLHRAQPLGQADPLPQPPAAARGHGRRHVPEEPEGCRRSVPPHQHRCHPVLPQRR